MQQVSLLIPARLFKLPGTRTPEGTHHNLGKSDGG